MNNQIPTINVRYFIEGDLQSSDDEGSPPSTVSADSTLTVDSTSAINSISSDDSAVAVPSTSAAWADHFVSPRISISSRIPLIPGPPLSPVFPMNGQPWTSPVPEMWPIPSTSRGMEVENYDDLRFEAARLCSFRNWPLSYIEATSLAAAGFYYTGDVDRVRCYECQVEISDWAPGHIPMLIHMRCSPECSFIYSLHPNNVAIGENPERVLRRTRRKRNISCPYGLKYQDSFDFNDHRFLRFSRTPSAYELSRLGLKRIKAPENFDYANYETRLRSFSTCTRRIRRKRVELADAGFYYIGIDDITACHHCGINIGDWRADENAWKRHASLSPSCAYVLSVRGWEYVNRVTHQEFYETFAEAPRQIANGNPERSNSDNDTNEMTLLQKIAALEEEKQALKNARLCKVCTAREASIIFLPCKHLATCDYCSPAFAKCNICQEEIKATACIFSS